MKLLLFTTTLFLSLGCELSPPTHLPARRDAWQELLSKAVDQSGRVDFVWVQKNRHLLESYLRFIATHSPKSTPSFFKDNDDSLAFYLNSYNALAMKAVIDYGLPAGLYSALDRARVFRLSTFSIGGESYSLHTYENDVIRKLGDPRIHFAINCMSIGCPPLTSEAFTSENVDAKLNFLTSQFANDERYVSHDPQTNTVRVSEILKWFQEDFQPSPVAYINQYRDMNIPETSRVEYIPYDWTLVKQTP